MLDLTQLTTAELSSLTKAMHEARFPEVWDDPIVWLAPFVIDLHVAATDEGRRRVVERGDERELASLDTWLRWPNRPEFKIFRSRLAEDQLFRRRVIREGVDFVRWALRPYILDDQAAGELVQDAVRLDDVAGS